jgi:hypothetical protein
MGAGIAAEKLRPEGVRNSVLIPTIVSSQCLQSEQSLKIMGGLGSVAVWRARDHVDQDIGDSRRGYDLAT